jgi:hypothetical protein
LDAFRYLFEGKGTRPSFGQGKNYEKHDFDQKFFPSNWDKVYTIILEMGVWSNILYVSAAN